MDSSKTSRSPTAFAGSLLPAGPGLTCPFSDLASGGSGSVPVPVRWQQRWVPCLCCWSSVHGQKLLQPLAAAAPHPRQRPVVPSPGKTMAGADPSCGDGRSGLGRLCRASHPHGGGLSPGPVSPRWVTGGGSCALPSFSHGLFLFPFPHPGEEHRKSGVGFIFHYLKHIWCFPFYSLLILWCFTLQPKPP